MTSDLETLDPKSGKPPDTRIKDVASLNGIIAKIIEADNGAAQNRVAVQKCLDGEPPLDDNYLKATKQDQRCNLNFGDMKARLKLEEVGYYDILESVPTIAYICTDSGEPAERANHDAALSEEFHRLLTSWNKFDSNHLLLVQKRNSHGIGVLYFGDDVDWRWGVAGLEDFKVSRNATLSEDDCDFATVLRDTSVAQLYAMIRGVDESDKRWDLEAVRTAIMSAAASGIDTTSWEKFQQASKNNDMFVSATGGDIQLAHAWSKEFSGKVSHYITLRKGGNKQFLFKAENRFDSVNQCFNYFPYEIGTNGTFHSVRGLAQEIYAAVQVINSLRNQAVDNAKHSGSLMLQPQTDMDQQDLAILFYAGAAYLPPNVKVVNASLANPTSNLLPVLADMQGALRYNSGDTNTRSNQASQREKTKYEIQDTQARESVLPTAAMDLFYSPWGRHLTEVWRRVSNKSLRKSDPGAKEVFEMRARIKERGVPDEALFSNKVRVTPVRAVGFGSPASRLLAFDEFIQYYGSLDPVGRNNLLRDRFALKVGYQQVDRYVPTLESGGRTPLDVEIAELQNFAMSDGTTVSVRPNDAHLLHLQTHFPDIEANLTQLEESEAGQVDPALLQAVQIKIEHIAGHMKILKPDKLNKAEVSEMTRLFNNAAQRVTAAMKAAEVAASKAAAEQQPQQAQPSPKVQERMEEHQLDMQIRTESHQLEMRLAEEAAAQKRVLADADSAVKLRVQANRARVLAGAPPLPAAPAPLPLPAPSPVAPSEPGII